MVFGESKMENKNTKGEKIANSIFIIIFFWILFIIFQMSTSYILNVFVKLNRFQNVFYTSLIELMILILFFRFSKSKKHEINNEKVEKIDLLDIFIFAVAWILSEVVILLIIMNVEDLLDFGYLQSYKNNYKGFLDGLEMSTMNQVYIFF